MTVPKDVFDVCVPVPESLYEKWAHGGGHNECGDEWGSLKEWALENVGALKKAVRSGQSKLTTKQIEGEK